MAKTNNQVSFRAAALIAGFATLAMVFCAPFAELYAYPKLVIAGNGATTISNIISHQLLFAAVIMSYIITFTGDVIAAWALYILLKPVNSYLSALAALFRLVFAIVAIVSVIHLVDAFRLITTPNLSHQFSQSQLQAQVMYSLNSFRYGFHFGLLFFGIYLVLLGYLVWRSTYITWVMGLLLIITGLGYFISALQPYLFPAVKVGFTSYTLYGEVIFMFWLIIRGWKIKEIN